MEATIALRRLVPPPDGPIRQVDWQSVEERLGMHLPEDYKWIVESYGPGSFDGFIHVFQPGHEATAIRLEHQVDRARQILSQLRQRGEIMPHDPSELVACGRTDNGDSVYWRGVSNADPQTWTIVVNEPRGTRWSSFDGPLAEFLRSVLSGDHAVGVFPDDFPSNVPRFASYEIR